MGKRWNAARAEYIEVICRASPKVGGAGPIDPLAQDTKQSSEEKGGNSACLQRRIGGADGGVEVGWDL